MSAALHNKKMGKGVETMKIGENTKILLWLSAVGFVLRLLYLFVSGDELVFPDEHRFWNVTRSLAERWVFEIEGARAHDMPLTALVLALFTKATGTGIIGAKILFAAISSCTIFIIGRIALHFMDRKITAWIAGLAAALYPFFVFYSTLILSETLFLFLVSLFFLLLLRSNDRAFAVAGLVAGFAHLTRPTLSFFLPVAFVWARKRSGIAWKHMFLAALLFFAVILPWGMRNIGVLGEFHLGTANSGHVLWEGNNPYNTTGGVAGGDLRYLDEMPEGLEELERDRWQRDRAVEFIKSDPARFAGMAFKKFARFWNIWPNAPGFDRGMYRWIAFASFAPVLLFGLASIYVLRKKWRDAIIVWLFVCYYTALHMVTIGSLRYRLPLEPLLVALAAACIGALIPYPGQLSNPSK
jgi:4-amino-4-deoxy-L-arabinose transferase-like glycosyltransferase